MRRAFFSRRKIRVFGSLVQFKAIQKWKIETLIAPQDLREMQTSNIFLLFASSSVGKLTREKGGLHPSHGSDPCITALSHINFFTLLPYSREQKPGNQNWCGITNHNWARLSSVYTNEYTCYKLLKIQKSIKSIIDCHCHQYINAHSQDKCYHDSTVYVTFPDPNLNAVIDNNFHF